MRSNPVKLVMIAYLSSVPFFAYLLMIAEGPTQALNDADYFNYSNALWNIIVTTTTGILPTTLISLIKLINLVGYGDYYARTLLGRTAIFMVSLWGTTVISLMVVSLSTIFTMKPPEEKVDQIFSANRR